MLHRFAYSVCGAKFCNRSNYAEVIKVVVGEERRTFLVHKDLICQRAAFFSATCSDNWKEGDEKVVHLPEQSANAFSVFLEATYESSTDIVGLVRATFPPSSTTGPSGELETYDDGTMMQALIDSWLLGDYMDNKHFKNMVIDALYKCSAMGLQEHITTSFLKKTPPGSALERFFVGIIAVCYVGELQALWETLGDSFKFALTDRLLRMRNFGKEKMDICDYHDHEDGVVRCENGGKK